MIEIVSIHVGKLQPLQVGNNVVQSGIFKHPISHRLKVTPSGLDGDQIGNLENHGGPDQAIYLFSKEAYAYWKKAVEEPLDFGTFGENIVLSSFGKRPLKIGDRFQINQVLLEVTFGRVPCARLGARMGNPSFVKQFVGANRSGVYARVLNQGSIQVGDLVSLLPTPEDTPTVEDLFTLFHSNNRSPTLMRQALAAPIAQRARAAFEYWLDQ